MASLSERLLLRAGPCLAAGLIRLTHACLRIETLREKPLQELWDARQHVILAFWHDQLFMMARGYPGPGASVLISASRDGEYIARTMDYFGIGSIRGSSTRGGRAAFREMVELAKNPVDLAITPDGPKGPRHEVKEGVVQLARLSGRPVVPMAFVCSRGHRFSSWDRFLLPLPPGRGIFSFGEPLYYAENDTVESFRQRLQQAMEENEQTAGERLKHYDLSPV
ncbi:MAG: lysophospholipid acyltransferase family protein [Desulfuromonadales bacterium]|nr:lysophospholipid acyltransferase family protein [Desulfuromonadales bacterium]